MAKTAEKNQSAFGISYLSLSPAWDATFCSRFKFRQANTQKMRASLWDSQGIGMKCSPPI